MPIIKETDSFGQLSGRKLKQWLFEFNSKKYNFILILLLLLDYDETDSKIIKSAEKPHIIPLKPAPHHYLPRHNNPPIGWKRRRKKALRIIKIVNPNNNDNNILSKNWWPVQKV